MDFVTYYIYTVENLEEALGEETVHYEHPSKIDLRLKEIKDHGYFFKAKDGYTEYYPPTSIFKVAFVTFQRDE